MAVIQQELTASASAPVDEAIYQPSTRRLGSWLAVAGWASLGLMWTTGSAELFGHDQQGMPGTFALGLFLFGWLVMVAAMMLPSSLPTFARVDEIKERVGDSDAPRFMGGFFLAWAAFGAAAFAADGVLHLAVEKAPWFSSRPSLIAGGVAIFAGAAELLGRTPPPLVPSTSAGETAFALGKAHAIDRIKRCWPLMLFAMAIGMNSAPWMVGLTLLMALELRPRASAVLRIAGMALVAVGVGVVVEPDWMPLLLATA